jgi:hypothetical protein
VIRYVFLLLTLMSSSAWARTIDEAPIRSVERDTVEFVLCRSSEHLLKLLESSSHIPSDDDIGAFNGKHGAQMCAYLNGEHLTFVRDREGVILDGEELVIVEVEYAEASSTSCTGPHLLDTNLVQGNGSRGGGKRKVHW